MFMLRMESAITDESCDRARYACKHWSNASVEQEISIDCNIKRSVVKTYRTLYSRACGTLSAHHGFFAAFGECTNPDFDVSMVM